YRLDCPRRLAADCVRVTEISAAQRGMAHRAGSGAGVDRATRFHCQRQLHGSARRRADLLYRRELRLRDSTRLSARLAHERQCARVAARRRHRRFSALLRFACAQRESAATTDFVRTPRALFQQYLICAVVTARWRRAGLPRFVAIWLGAATFALMHTPNASLMLATFFGGLCWCALYLRERALLPLAFS